MSELIRSFVAVKIEAPDVLAQITRLQTDLQKTGLSAKFVESENLHLTLKFLGEVPAPKLEIAKIKLSEVKSTSFKITLRGVGAFPNISRPRVLWIGVSNGAEALISLANQVREKLSSLKFPGTGEEFQPHLTIARLKGPLNKESRNIIDACRDTVFGDQEIRYFSLYRSILTPKGPIYKELMRYELP
ncbi:MAG: RNA 2',3'-cyclic phosphodiesterase [Thermofilum sp.]|jgi:2'-5' RNA ligase|nr:RNA 2',3'-cyclic phosphodiesterase [Thermofilum sp.]